MDQGAGLNLIFAKYVRRVDPHVAAAQPGHGAFIHPDLGNRCALGHLPSEYKKQRGYCAGVISGVISVSLSLAEDAEDAERALDFFFGGSGGGASLAGS